MPSCGLRCSFPKGLLGCRELLVMKILGIGGSPRSGGNTDCLLKEILRGAEDAGAETEIIFLRDYEIAPCNGCEKCRKDLTCTRFNDDMNIIYPMIEEADILVTGSPVYNYNITSRMKSFIDRLYPYYIFSDDRPGKYSSRLSGRNKKAMVFSVGEQTDPGEAGFAEEAMSRPLEALGYEIIKTLVICGFFEKGAVLKNEKVMKEVYESGAEIAAKK